MGTLTLRHPGRCAQVVTTITVAPRCCIPDPDSRCECGGVLGYVQGRWQHTDWCLHCIGRPGRCEHLHEGCETPAPLTCAHRQCRRPVTLDLCADSGDAAVCCGCCWNLEPNPGA
jgi:hypothetical protein